MNEVNAQVAADSPKAAESKSETILDVAKAQAAEVAKAEVVPEVKVEEKPVEKSPEVKPEKYELKLPEKSLLKPEALESISSYAIEHGLSKEQAQGLVERENKVLESYANGLQEDLKKKSGEWIDQIKLDAEVGGEHFSKNAELAKRVFKRFGSESLIKTLNDTGLGNHPELIRLGVRLGKAMSEDQLVMGGPVLPSKKSLAERMYGSKKEATG